MPRIKFITLDFGSSKKRPLEEPITPILSGSDNTQESMLTEDRKSQLIHNIDSSNDPRYPSKRPMVLMSLLLLLTVGIAGFSFFRYAGLQKENFSLNDDVRKLNKSINALEEENRDLALKTDRAEKERQKIKDSLETYKKQNESLQFESQKSEAKINSVLEEKTYLEDILINKTKEIERLKTGGSPSAVNNSISSGISEDLAQKLSQKDEEIRRLNEQNKVLTEKLQKLYSTASALEDTLADAKKAINGQYGNTVDLGSISVNSSSVSAPVVPSSPEKNLDSWRSSAKKEGRVLAINEEHGFVVIDLGKVNGLNNGMELYLKRGGETIATLSVLEVRDVMTACNIKNISPHRKIEINDQVSLQK